MLKTFLSGIKKPLRIGAWAAALWLCLAAGDRPFPVVGAYVLEGPHVLDLMVKHLAGAKTLQVQQNVEIQDPAVAGQPVELKETLSYIFPDRFRSDAWYQGTNRIFVASFGRYLTAIDERVTSYKEGRFDRYKDPLLYQTRFSILKSLLASGIDVGTTTLGKTEETTAFVIGARYPDSSVSQLWVDKERFLPIRLIFVEKGAGDEIQHLEFVYRNWQAFGKVWYPMLIETYHNDVLIRRNQARTVKVDSEFSPQLLDITYLMSIYGTIDRDQNRQAPPEADDVQRTIEDFSKKFDP
ncbi:MAG: hypothetical protein P8X55_08230 [Desulfosarcinaceae bacterium]